MVLFHCSQIHKLATPQYVSRKFSLFFRGLFLNPRAKGLAKTGEYQRIDAIRFRLRAGRSRIIAHTFGIYHSHLVIAFDQVQR